MSRQTELTMHALLPAVTHLLRTRITLGACRHFYCSLISGRWTGTWVTSLFLKKGCLDPFIRAATWGLLMQSGFAADLYIVLCSTCLLIIRENWNFVCKRSNNSKQGASDIGWGGGVVWRYSWLFSGGLQLPPCLRWTKISFYSACRSSHNGRNITTDPAEGVCVG